MDSVAVQHLDAFSPELGRLPGPTQHGERVGDVDVRPVQAPVITDLGGELQCVAKLCDPVVAAAEVSEVACEDGTRPDFRFTGSDLSGKVERHLPDLHGLLAATVSMSPPASDASA